MKANQTQAALEMAAAGRAYVAAIARLDVAERIPPIRRRRFAAVVNLTIATVAG